MNSKKVTENQTIPGNKKSGSTGSLRIKVHAVHNWIILRVNFLTL